MAVQYAPTKLRVPPGFQNILEGFAREVLREQPEDIIQFGAQYFRAQLSIRDDTGKDDAKRGEQLEKLQKGEDIDIDLGDPQVHAAATKIQASFRGHKAREDVKHKKEEEAAAIKIQSSFRGHKAREDVKELRESKSRESAEVSPSKEVEKPVEDEVDIDLNDPEVQGAALKIQASFRGHKARTEVQKIKSSEAVAADVKDKVEKEETVVTDQPTEDAPKEEEIDIDLNDPQVEKAASVIQSTFRAHKSRESVKLMAEKEDMTQEPKEDAVDKVEENTADLGDASAQDKAEEIDIDLNDPDVHKAASKIQASFRGHKTRQELKDKSPSQSRESVKTEEHEPSAADDVAPETTFEQQPPAETESKPLEAVETQEVPAETLDVSTEAQKTSAETQQVPAETQEIPTETQEAPAETQESPSETQEVPAESQEASAETQQTPVDADAVDKAEDAVSESVDVAQEAQSESQAEVEGQEAEATPDLQESTQQEDDTDKPETVAEASQPTSDKAES